MVLEVLWVNRVLYDKVLFDLKVIRIRLGGVLWRFSLKSRREDSLEGKGWDY